nr:hypothetical protein [Tanacetum cinerariifolium]
MAMCKVFKPLPSIMSTIMDVRCVLSQKAFDAFCEKFHIPEEVHHVLPDQADLHCVAKVSSGSLSSVLLLPDRCLLRNEDEPRLLETTVGRTVPLLLVAPDRGESELDTSVDKLFDEGGSGAQTGQGDSVGGGGEQ